MWFSKPALVFEGMMHGSADGGMNLRRLLRGELASKSMVSIAKPILVEVVMGYTCRSNVGFGRSSDGR